MSVITNNLLLGDEGYFLTKSLRFRSSASAYLNRTPTTPTNNLKWTWSGWVKRGSISAAGGLFDAYLDGVNFSTIYFQADGTIQFYNILGGADSGFLTTPVYRDPSAWYHIVFIYDSANATAADRGIIYINGVRQTVTNPYGQIGLNEATYLNNSYASYIGRQVDSGYYFDGYLTEVNFIDGQALTPSSFGETSTSTGVWIPKKYTGTYGTNGFYLPFTDVATTSGSNAGLGKDFSGNGNYWTTNNISVTSGSTYDSMKDVPTLTDTDTANYAVMNPLVTGSFTTLSNGNLNTLGNTSSNNGNSRSSFAMLTGKWYLEVTLTANALSTYPQLGIMTTADGNRPNNGYPQAGYSGSSVNPSQSVIYMANGQKQISDTASSYGSSFTNGDVIGIAIDSDNGAIYFGKQTGGTGSMVWQNSGVPTSGSSKTGAALTWTGGTVEHLFSIADYNGTATAANFGQRPFSATPPTGFKALNTFNLPTPTIGATASSQANKYFDISLYTGTGATQSITGLGFQPDFTWIKKRNSTSFSSHQLVDAVRGTSAYLFTDSTNAEVTATDRLTAFNSNGFTLSTASQVNGNTDTFVAWAWDANGSGSSNTAGSITSTVSANTTAGFSIVTYTGNGSNSTIGHGLGVAPSFIIAKARNSAQRWTVYTGALGNAYYGYLNETFAFDTANGSLRWNTAPTSSVFGVGTSVDVNNNTTTYVAYCFAEVAGYSKFGSYTGNGSSDGTMVFTGFKPKFVIVKRTNDIGSWIMTDSARSTYNVNDKLFNANTSGAEFTTSDIKFDYLSNGFKLREVNGAINASGSTYIYMAFAENPFKYSLAR